VLSGDGPDFAECYDPDLEIADDDLVSEGDLHISHDSEAVMA
jgi:hypothetical protein